MKRKRPSKESQKTKKNHNWGQADKKIHRYMFKDELKSSYTKSELEDMLTKKQVAFCKNYILEWHGTKAAMKAYGSKYNVAASTASMLLRNPKIKQYIEIIRKDYDRAIGISKAGMINELRKIAYSSVRHLHNSWIELAEWERIKKEDPDVLDAVESIDTKVEKQMAYDEGIGAKVPVKIHYVKIKLYSKLQAIAEINKMQGYNAPEQHEVKQQVSFDIDELTDEEKSTLLNLARKTKHD
jgi:phage terminase small subunit